jgi:hypothetical protein
MTQTTNDRRARYEVTNPAGQSIFDIDFELDNVDYIRVYADNDLIDAADYTVDLETLKATLDTPAVQGTIITLEGYSLIERTTDYPLRGALRARLLNADFDKFTRTLQELRRDVDLCLRINRAEDVNVSTVMPLLDPGHVIVCGEEGFEIGPDTTDVATVAASIANVDAVAAALTNINIVATDLNSFDTIGDVAANIDAVAAVGNNIVHVLSVDDNEANITAVAGNATNINLVAGNATNINTVASINGVINTVAGISANVTTVAGISSAVSNVSGIAAAVSAVSGISSAVSNVSSISANVSTVAGISGNVTTVAGMSANITTVAGMSGNISTVVANITAIQNASTNATNAATSASNALTSENNAAASAIAAAASAAQFSGTSTTSVAIATGTKAFTTQSGKLFNGENVRVYSAADPTNFMDGLATYSGTSLSVDVSTIGGSGTKTDWVIKVNGAKGVQGPSGSLDFTALSAETALASGDLFVINDISEGANNKMTTLDVFKGFTVLPTTALAVGDEMPFYDISGTVAGKVTVQNFWNMVTGLTSETALAVGDEFPVYDVSASNTDKVTLQSFYNAINILTAETAAPATNDVLLMYDTSATNADKITVADFFKAFTSFSTVTMASGDEIPFYDISGAVAGKATVAALWTAMTSLSLSGVLPSAQGGAGTVNGIMKANGSGTTSAAAAGTDYVSPTGTETLTNKRINPRIQAVTSSATVTANADTDDAVVITAQAAGLTLANPTGTPVQGQGLIIRIKDNGTARSISFGTNFRAMGTVLPTTTVISKTLYLSCVYNSTDTKWDVTGVAKEA